MFGHSQLEMKNDQGYSLVSKDSLVFTLSSALYPDLNNGSVPELERIIKQDPISAIIPYQSC